jgi:hypothetical protein
MKYMNNYRQFRKRQQKLANKQGAIIEKELKHEFSGKFWSLCLKSKLFDLEQKEFIKENCLDVKINLNESFSVNEGWLGDAWNWTKKQGGKLMNFFVKAVEKVRNGINWFIEGAVKLCKELFFGLIKFTKELGQKMFGKPEKEKQVADAIEKCDEAQLEKERPSFKDMLSYWFTSKPYDTMNNKLGAAMDGQTESTKQKTLQALDELENDPQFEKEAEELEKEAGKKNESSDYFDETDVDYMYEFSKFHDLHVENMKIQESESKANPNLGKTSGSAYESVMEWLNSFFAQDAYKDAKGFGGKVYWFMRLIFRIFAGVCSIIVKLIELGAETGLNLILNSISKFTAYCGGPEAMKYVAYGSMFGALVGICLDIAITFMAEEGSALYALGDVKMAILSTIFQAGKTDPVVMTVKYLIVGLSIIYGLKHIYHKYHQSGGKTPKTDKFKKFVLDLFEGIKDAVKGAVKKPEESGGAKPAVA